MKKRYLNFSHAGKITSRRLHLVPFANVAYKTDAPDDVDLPGLTAKIDSIHKTVKDTVDKAKSDITVDVDGKITAAKTEAIADTEAKVKVVKDELDKVIDAQDKMIAERKTFHLGEGVNKESFKTALLAGLKAKEAELANYKDVRKAIPIELKAVGDIGSANFTTTGTQTFVGPDMIPGVSRAAYQQQHMRNILGTTTTKRDSISVIRGSRGEGGPTGVAAGALKPQGDADWVKVIVPITKIGVHYNVPEEWLEDVEWLADDISTTGIEEMLLVEDTKIISNVTGGEFGGLVQNSTAYASPAGLALGIEAANNYDVLVAAMTQLKNLNRVPNFAVTDNDSYARMILTKATTGEYVFGAPNMSIPNIFGVPLFGMNNTALADKFIVGDRNQATIAIRAGITVRFYDQHANNAIYNLVTIVIEERIALIVKRIDAFIYGDFSDARAALETA